MDEKLCIFICDFFHEEAIEILHREKISDVVIEPFVSNCGHPPIGVDEISAMIALYKDKYTSFHYIGSACIASAVERLANDSIQHLKVKLVEQCFEMVISKELLLFYISQGYYLLTPGWLKNFESRIREWGFDQSMAQQFFKECSSKLLLFDTGIMPDATEKLKALGLFLDMPTKILPVGLEHFRLFLNQIVMDWRFENEKKFLNNRLSQITRQTSDYALIFDQIGDLVKVANEKAIVKQVFHLINMLFSPSSIIYTPMVDSKMGERIYSKESEEKLFLDDDKRNEFTQDDCLKVNVIFQNIKLGLFEVYNVIFPEYMQYYHGLADVLAGVIGLAISNARKYTELELRETELVYYTKQLEEINALKDRFFSIVAHDLTGPLGSINSLVEMLLDEYDTYDDATRKTFLKRINEAGITTFNFLKNLLQWARNRTGRIQFNPDHISIRNVVIDVIELLKEKAVAKNISLDYEIPETLIAYSDHEMLHTILRNLISNALKFSYPLSVITIGGKKVEGGVSLWVQDQGMGMTEGEIAKLFQLEVIYKRNGTANEGGTGLGLLLCKDFIEKHNGNISITSILGKGTIFTIFFPDKINPESICPG
ncbi:MAG: DUF1638 domain-containing protein [Bacteroidetes bacterium]|nr:DUF1638 domain-containing protein [Bacteroidota bacterium]